MKKKVMKVMAVTGLILLSIVLANVLDLPTIAEAVEGGTCCPEHMSTCYPPGNPPVNNNYWRSDGKPCSAPI